MLETVNAATSQSGREFQTNGPATAEAHLPNESIYQMYQVGPLYVEKWLNKM